MRTVRRPGAICPEDRCYSEKIIEERLRWSGQALRKGYDVFESDISLTSFDSPNGGNYK
jgi:hypothetical protein